MKKFIVLIMSTLMLVSCVSLGGCRKIANEDGFKLITGALAESLIEDIYYIKRGVTDDIGNIVLANTNVMCETGSLGELIKGSDGKYVDYKAKTEVKDYTKATGEEKYRNLTCGMSVSKDKNNPSPTGYLFLSEGVTGKDDTTVKLKQKMMAEEFVASDVFAPFSLAAVLQEITTWTNEDLDFSIKNAGISKKGYVTELVFKMSDKYCDNYKSTNNGATSLFDGKYLTFEIAYGRVSNIFVYKDDLTVSFLPFEYKSYKLQIVYMSAKFSPPAYDETYKKDKVEYQSYNDGVIVALNK